MAVCAFEFFVFFLAFSGCKGCGDPFSPFHIEFYRGNSSPLSPFCAIGFAIVRTDINFDKYRCDFFKGIAAKILKYLIQSYINSEYF